MIKCFIIWMATSILFFIGGNFLHIGLYGESIWVILTERVRDPKHKGFVKAPGAILLQLVALAGASSFVAGLFFAALCAVLLIK